MTNQFRAHGVATGANVLTPDQWANLGARQQGFVAGTALSRQVNTPLRQATSWAEVLGEFVNDAGFDALDNGDLGELQENFEAALRAYIGGVIPDSALWHYGQASGSSSALIVASTVPTLKTPYVNGSTILLKIPSTLDAAAGATIKIGSGATVALCRNDGSPIVKGDLPPDSTGLIYFNGPAGQWRLVGPGWAEFARNDVAPTLYVSPAGDDNTADGTTPETAFATPRQAILVGRQRYPLTATVLTIDIADGVYPALGGIPAIAGTLALLGNETTPANVVISGTASAGRAVHGFEGGSIEARGITFQNTSTGAHTIAGDDCRIFLRFVRLVTTVTNTASQVYTNPNCTITLRSDCAAQGNAGSLFWANGGAIILGAISEAEPFTIIGPTAYSSATARASENGLIRLYGGATFPGGAVTGVRYRVEDNATIKAFGNGEEAFPGDQPGVTDDNGIYKP